MIQSSFDLLLSTVALITNNKKYGGKLLTIFFMQQMSLNINQYKFGSLRKSVLITTTVTDIKLY